MNDRCESMYGFFFVLGFLIASFSIGVVALTIPTPTHAAAVAALKKCELELPRNQRCVITAVPPR